MYLSVGVAPEGQPLVFDHSAREIGEDRRQSGEAFAVCYFSNGRGGSTEGVVQSNSGADRTIVAASAGAAKAMTAQDVRLRLRQ